MNRTCDAGGICAHIPQCDHFCHFTDAKLLYLAPEPDPSVVIRKIKPYPVIPADIESVPDTWHTIGAWMLGGIMTVLLVICLGLFFTGLWVWSLLI